MAGNMVMPHHYRAKRLPKHAGLSGWREILGASPTAHPLDHDITADFTVIGAGFAGLAAARRLDQLNAGASIAVIDAGMVGEGAAGRNSGFMIDLPHELTSENYAGSNDSHDRDIIRLNRLAIEFAREAVLDYGIDADFFDPVGKINGAASELSDRQNRSYAEHLDKLGERHEFLDSKAMFELTGSRHYLSGLFTPGTVLLQPAGYVRGFAAGLAPQVRIYENTPVTGFRREGTCWRISTKFGSVLTRKLVLANNGHIESFGIKRSRLMHIFLFACMTRELDQDTCRRLGGQSKWGITPSDPMGTTVRRIGALNGGNRIVVRTCAEFQPNMETSQRQMSRAKKIMREKFDARFPQLSDVEMQYVWSGHLCLSRNRVSVTGEIDEGVYAACCQNGLGTTRGTLTGIAAAEDASGMQSEITEFFAAQDEPAMLPPAPIAKIGATAFLKWKEWRAGPE